MTQIAETFATISKQSYLDSCIPCEATDRALRVLDEAPIGSIIYIADQSDAEGNLLQLFTNCHDAACAFVGTTLLWDATIVTPEMIIEFHRQARAFLDAPKDYQASFAYDEDWGGGATIQLYAAEVIS